MNLVDSSAWIEYLVDGPNAESWVEPIGAIDVLVVPTIVMTEVLRWAHAHSHDALLDQIESLLTRGLVVDVRALVRELDAILKARAEEGLHPPEKLL